jgi:hypothetical protein
MTKTKSRPSNKEKSGPISAGPLVTLTPQPHGGALRTGGTNGGRPPSWYLARVVEMLEADMPAPGAEDTPATKQQRKVRVLEFARDVVQGKYAEATIGDRLRAWKELLDKAMPTKHEVTLVSPEITGRLEQQIHVINSRQTWTPAELLEALDPIWS